MKIRYVILLSLLFFLLSLLPAGAATVSETEPNDTPAQANSLLPSDRMEAAINPIADVDYFSLGGVNTTWGFIALLETDSSATSQDGVLTALANDGTTVLSTDQGSWSRGSGLALQNYANGPLTHYLRVNEGGDDATISDYTLRYHRTIVSTKPEVEPNETRFTGTPSSYSMDGVLDTGSDVDCFAFQGKTGEDFLFAVNSDPEGDGSPVDIQLDLIDTADAVLASADHTGVGGNEFLEHIGLPADGVFAYCLSVAGGTAGTTATYHAGLVRNGFLYTSSYHDEAIWTNRPPSGNADIGDLLTFELTVTNTSPLALPDDVDVQVTFDGNCLSFQNAIPSPTYSTFGNVRWYGLRPSGLVSGETFLITVEMLAERACNDNFHQSTLIRYFFLGAGFDEPYTILGHTFLPLIAR